MTASLRWGFILATPTLALSIYLAASGWHTIGTTSTSSSGFAAMSYQNTVFSVAGVPLLSWLLCLATNVGVLHLLRRWASPLRYAVAFAVGVAGYGLSIFALALIALALS